MIMKLYACFILIVLVLHAETRYQADNPELRNEFNNILRSLTNRRNFNKELETKERHVSEGKLVSAAKKSEDASSDETSTVENPARIAIFNAGEYNAHLTVNYIINGIQQEQELLSEVRQGQHRSAFMPVTATYIRIRIQKENANGEFIVDQQLPDVKDGIGFCCLLAHTSSHPVYGICPGTYKDMLEAWGL